MNCKESLKALYEENSAAVKSNKPVFWFETGKLWLTERSRAVKKALIG
jgi:hypothetical protein